MKAALKTLIVAGTLAAGTAFAEPAVGPDNAWLNRQEISAPVPSAAAPQERAGVSRAAAQPEDKRTMRTDHIHVDDAAPGQAFSPNP